MNQLRDHGHQKKYLRIYLVILILLASFAGGLFVGRSTAPAGTGDSGSLQLVNKYTNKSNVDFALFWQVWDLTLKKYVHQPIDQQKMLYGAIAGAVHALGDPYTLFMTPDETQGFNDELAGTLEGIGAELGMKNDLITVIAPIAGSPAERAGIRARDIIFKIDGQDTIDMTLSGAVSKIRGAKGTSVTLTIKHAADKDVQDITVVRDTITVQSAKLDMKTTPKGKSVALITISTFNEDTAKDLRKIIPELFKNNAKGIILDLRMNAGGYLDQSVQVASEFLSTDAIVVIEEDSSGKRREYISDGSSRLEALPIAVLVDEGTASAAEILAGALRDNRSIQLIGAKTFGKGSVQEIKDLEGGSSLRVSIAKWLTPKGQSIDKEGLSPDITVERTEEQYNRDEDPQYDKAQEIIDTLIE